MRFSDGGRYQVQGGLTQQGYSDLNFIKQHGPQHVLFTSLVASNLLTSVDRLAGATCAVGHTMCAVVIHVY